jgi:uncharacterized repeat protein (TIGR01451 family)
MQDGRRVADPGAMSGVGAGVPKRGWTTTRAANLPTQAILHDLDGDQTIELVVVAGGRLYAYATNGAQRWASPPLNATTIQGVQDLDGDGQQEILAFSEAPLGGLWIVDAASGSVRESRRAGSHHLGVSKSALLVIQADLDTPQEIVWNTLTQDDFRLLHFADVGIGHSYDFFGAGTEGTEAFVAGDLDGDGDDEVLWTRGANVWIAHPEESAAGRPQSQPGFLPGAGFEGAVYLLDTDLDGTQEVVFMGGAPDQVGFGTAEPIGLRTKSLAWRWACMFGDSDSYLPPLLLTVPKGPPGNLGGWDAKPEIVFGLRGGGANADADFRPCPADPADPDPLSKDYVVTGATTTTHLFEAQTGHLKVVVADLTPIATGEIRKPGVTDLVACAGGCGAAPTYGVWSYEGGGFDAGALVLKATFQTYLPQLPEETPRRSWMHPRGGLVIHPTNLGERRILLGGTNVAAWGKDDFAGHLATVVSTTHNCGDLLDWATTADGKIWLLFRSATKLCLLDQDLALVRDFALAPDVPMDDPADFSIRSANLDGGVGRDELAMAGKVYDVDPLLPIPLTPRFSFAGAAEMWTDLAGSLTPAAAPVLVTLEVAARTVRAYTAGGLLWSHVTPPTYRLDAYAVAGRFTNPTSTDTLVVLDRSAPDERLLRNLHWNGLSLDVTSAVVPFFYQAADPFVSPPEVRAFPVGLGSPGAWGVADTREDLLLKDAGSPSATSHTLRFLDVITGTDIAPPVTLAVGVDADRANYTGFVDVDNDGKKELVTVANAGSPNPQVRRAIEVYDAMGGLAVSEKWDTSDGLGGDGAEIVAPIDVDGDADKDLALLTGQGDLRVLDGTTGVSLPGYPVNLVHGLLRPGVALAPFELKFGFAWDVDADAKDEFVFASGDGWVYAVDFNAAGAPLLQWAAPMGSRVNGLVAADFDGNAVEDLVVALADGRLVGLRASSDAVSVSVPVQDSVASAPGILVSGAASGADTVEVFLNCQPERCTPIATSLVAGGAWSIPLTLPKGDHEIVVRATLAGVSVAHGAVYVAYEVDYDGDAVASSAEDNECALSPDAPQNATIYPGAPELPDGRDNNCNGLVDDGSYCAIGGVSYLHLTTHPANQCQRCNTVANPAAWTLKPPGTPCDDGDLGTAGDDCDALGVCAGTPLGCSVGVCAEASVADGTKCDVTYDPPGASCGAPGNVCSGKGACLACVAVDPNGPPTVKITSPLVNATLSLGVNPSLSVTTTYATVGPGALRLKIFVDGVAVADKTDTSPTSLTGLTLGRRHVAAKLTACDSSALANPESEADIWIRVEGPCTTDANCDDGNPCSGHDCKPNGICAWAAGQPVELGGCCIDDYECAGHNGVCAGGICAECAKDSDCGDADICTVDWCSAGVCAHLSKFNCCEADAECDDYDHCTANTCNTATHTCTFPSNGLLECCNQDTDCVSADPCQAVLCYHSMVGNLHYCRRGPGKPGCCVAAIDCNDGNPCTIDVCAGGIPGQCNNTATVPGCCTTHTDCGDANPATLDLCIANLCSNTPDPGYCALPAASQLVITEIMLSSGNDPFGEYLEIFNPGTTPVNLAGWSLDVDGAMLPLDKAGAGGTPVGLNVYPGTYYTLGQTKDKLLSQGHTPDYQIGWGFSLNDLWLTNGAPLAYWIRLQNPSGATVDEVYYNSATWPAPQLGRSLELEHPWANNNDPTKWHVAGTNFDPAKNTTFGAFDYYGSPRADNQSSARGLPSVGCAGAGLCGIGVCSADSRCAIQNSPGCCVADADCPVASKCETPKCDVATHTCLASIKDPACCVAHADCDDDNPCNVDRCFSGKCRYSDNLVQGCCVTDVDCDDADVCTIDQCNVDNNTCNVPIPVQPGGGAPLTLLVCCNDLTQCNDGEPATKDMCPKDQHVCVHVLDPEYCDALADPCDDPQPCTQDSCDLVLLKCRHDPVGTPCCHTNQDCADADPCSLDICTPTTGVCTGLPMPGCCSNSATCDDLNSCTENLCSASHVCHYPWITGCCKVAADCNDGIPGTSDTCVLGNCDHSMTPGVGCTVGAPQATLQAQCGPDPDGSAPCYVWTCPSGSCAAAAVPACCTINSDCNDGKACTADLCHLGSQTCKHVPVLVTGCCFQDGDCFDTDADPCTLAACIDGLCKEPATPGCVPGIDPPFRIDVTTHNPASVGLAASPGSCWKTNQTGYLPGVHVDCIGYAGAAGPGQLLMFPGFNPKGYQAVSLLFQYARTWNGAGGGIDDGNPGCTTLPGTSDLKLTEVYAGNPFADTNGDGVANPGDQFVELRNFAEWEVDASGIRIEQGAGFKVVPPGTCLQAGHSMTVFGTWPGTLSPNGSVVLGGLPGLAPSNASVTLKSAGGGSTFDTVGYTTELGSGDSLVKQDEVVLGSPMVAHRTAPQAVGKLFSPLTCQNGHRIPYCMAGPHTLTITLLASTVEGDFSSPIESSTILMGSASDTTGEVPLGAFTTPLSPTMQATDKLYLALYFTSDREPNLHVQVDKLVVAPGHPPIPVAPPKVGGGYTPLNSWDAGFEVRGDLGKPVTRSFWVHDADGDPISIDFSQIPAYLTLKSVQYSFVYDAWEVGVEMLATDYTELGWHHAQVQLSDGVFMPSYRFDWEVSFGTKDTAILVWAPPGVPAADGAALTNALQALGVGVQQIQKLTDVIASKGEVTDAIFVTLGAGTTTYTPTPDDRLWLEDLMDKGGHVYVEGGAYFGEALDTHLHRRFGIVTVKEDAGIGGLLTGTRFLAGSSLVAPLTGAYAADVDLIAPAAGFGGVATLADATQQTVAVARAEPGLNYRTYGTSVLTSQLDNPVLLLQKVLGFFADGDHRSCATHTACFDGLASTVDQCVGGLCQNPPKPTPDPGMCLDDLGCAANQACLATGACGALGTSVGGGAFVPTHFNCLWNDRVAMFRRLGDRFDIVKKVSIKIDLELETVWNNLTQQWENRIDDLRIRLRHGGVEVVLKGTDLEQTDIDQTRKELTLTWDRSTLSHQGVMDAFVGQVVFGYWDVFLEDVGATVCYKVVNLDIFAEGTPHPPCAGPMDCDNGQECDGVESCVGGTCVAGPLGACDRLADATMGWVSTTEPHTPEIPPALALAVGEGVSFKAQVRVAQGKATGVVWPVTFEPGLTILSIDSLTPSSPDLYTGYSGGWGGLLKGTWINPTQDGFTIAAGTIFNLNQNDAVAELLEVRFTARLKDLLVPVTNGKLILGQSAPLGSTGSLLSSITTKVVEPVLSVTSTPATSVADAGDVVTTTVTVTHGPASLADGFDLAVEDRFTDPQFRLVDGSVSAPGGVVELGNGVSDSSVRVRYDTLALSATVSFTYQARLTFLARSGDTATHTASLTWSSLPADADPEERSYGPISASSTVSVPAPSSLTHASLETSEPTTGLAQYDPAKTDLAIGEVVTTRYRTALAEGTTTANRWGFTAPYLGARATIQSASVFSLGANLNPAFPTGNPVLRDNFNGDGRMDTAILDFGNTTNAYDNAANALDEIVVQVVWRLANDGENTNGDLLGEQMSFTWSAGAPMLVASELEVVEPSLDATQLLDFPTGDAGDVLTYKLRAAHVPGSTQDAVQARLSAAIPATLTYLAGSLASTGAWAATSVSFAGGVVTGDFATLPLGQTGEITYQVTVNPTIEPSVSHVSTGTPTWRSVPLVELEPRSYLDTSTTIFTSLETATTLTEFTTSDPFTTNPVNGPQTDLGIGERLEYRTTVRFIEGTHQAGVVVVQLPLGLVVYEVVSTAVLSRGANLGGPGLPLVGTPAVLVDTDTDGVADRATWTFAGAITNLADGLQDAKDVVVLEVVMRVKNLPANQGGVDNDSAANAWFTHATGASSSAPMLTDLVEPAMSVAQLADQATGDAGDVITFTVRVDHTAAATGAGMDVKITHVLPADTTYVALSLASTGIQAATTLSEAAGTITASWDWIPLGFYGEITFKAAPKATVQPGQVITNTSSLAYDTLDAGPPAVPDERAYTGTASTTTFTVDTPTAAFYAESLFATSQPHTLADRYNPVFEDLTMGEVATIHLTGRFIEGTTPMAEFVYFFDPAIAVLEVVSASLYRMGAQITTGCAGTITYANVAGADTITDKVTVDFCGVTNAPDNLVNAQDELEVEVLVRVLNLAQNAPGDTATDSSKLIWRVGQTFLDDLTFELVEPGLAMAQVTSTGTGDAGDEITLTVTVNHPLTSTADARDAVVDGTTSGPEMTYVPGSAVWVSGPVPAITEPLGLLRFAWGSIGRTETAVVTYKVRLQNTAEANTTYTASVALGWSSSLGTPVGDRSYVAGDTDAVTTTNPAVTSLTEMSTNDASTGTAINGPETDLTIGERIVWRFEVTFPEGITSGAVAEMRLPTVGARYDEIASKLVAKGANLTMIPSLNNPGLDEDTNADGFNDRSYWTLGPVLNTSDNLADLNDRVVFEVEARVLDHPDNQGGIDDNVLSMARLTYTAGGPASQSVLTDLVEPWLSMTHVASNPSPPPGTIVTYTMTITHTAASTADAFDDTITVTLSPSLNWVGLQPSTCPGLVVNAAGAPVILFDWNPLTRALGTCSVVYQAQVKAGTPPGTLVFSGTILRWWSGPGSAEKRSRLAQGDVTVTVP